MRHLGRVVCTPCHITRNGCISFRSSSGPYPWVSCSGVCTPRFLGSWTVVGSVSATRIGLPVSGRCIRSSVLRFRMHLPSVRARPSDKPTGIIHIYVYLLKGRAPMGFSLGWFLGHRRSVGPSIPVLNDWYTYVLYTGSCNGDPNHSKSV